MEIILKHCEKKYKVCEKFTNEKNKKLKISDFSKN